LIQEARELGAAAALRVDAVKALQTRWQTEAQSVPLDRKTEQKLWEIFRAPLDEAFQRKGSERQHVSAPLNAHDRMVIDASQALEAANASGDATKIRAAMAALDAALRGQAAAVLAEKTSPAPEVRAELPASGAAPDQDAAPSDGEGSDMAKGSAPSAEGQEVSGDTGAQSDAAAPPVAKVQAPKRVVAVRGDDRPGQKKTEAPAPTGRRDARPGERSDRPGERMGERGQPRMGERDRSGRGDFEQRPDRGPRLGDAAFRAQREALERAEMSLRKLAAQAHGETLTRLMGAWQERQADALPSTQELGRAVNASTRQVWTQALSSPAKESASTALLRLEMAAEVPTPAEHLSARRALQLQLLTQRNQPGPAETWAQDVAQVLSGPHDEVSARRLQNALKGLLRS
jgi:hypothetical protein